MKRFGTRPERDFTDVTELFLISPCENEVAEIGCCLSLLFSFGVAITTTSSMSITLVVSAGASIASFTIEAFTGVTAETTAAPAAIIFNDFRTVLSFIFSLFIVFVNPDAKEIQIMKTYNPNLL